MRKKIQVGITGLMLLLGGIAIGQVSMRRNPNIAEAQRFCQMAIDKVSAAQQANQFDMQGHAKHAKELLEQAQGELNAAASIANQRR